MKASPASKGALKQRRSRSGGKTIAQSLDDHGWTSREARDTRARLLASFAEDWEAPGMEAYDEDFARCRHGVALLQSRSTQGCGT